jgi:hypothetical protein
MAQPGHQAAQARTDLLQGMLGALTPQRLEARAARLVLEHELARERAVLDLAQDLLHALLDPGIDDPRPAREVAVLGGVGDRVAHVGDPTLVDEVDDQLHLVDGLEVRHLGGVARLHQRLVAGGHQRREAPAEHRLLAEEIGLRLLAEVRLDDPGTTRTDALRVGEADLQGVSRGIGVHRHEGRDALPFRVERAHRVPGPLGRHHEDVDALGRSDAPEVDVEAVGHGEVVAALGQEPESLRSPTTTFTPESRRLRVWAWPWLP